MIEPDSSNPIHIIDRFHQLYYSSLVWLHTTWLGAPVQKFVSDLIIYQELIVRHRPELIIETGTYKGGSALFIASICDLINHGQVITIDIHSDPDRPVHPRIAYLCGNSTDAHIIEIVRQQARGRATMVILDSCHERDHVLAELEAYAPLVTMGQYLIVEDTNLNGRPVRPDFGPGPAEAVREFLTRHPEFVVDPGCEKFFLSANPEGYLRKVGRRPDGAQPDMTGLGGKS